MEVTRTAARQLRASKFQACCRCFSTRPSLPIASSIVTFKSNHVPESSSRKMHAKPLFARASSSRPFSTSSVRFNWLQPRNMETIKSRVGRPRMPTGGSTRGTTLVWGEYGLRMTDHDRRVSAKQFKIAEETIRRRLRGLNYKLYTRVAANIGVYTKGNDVRMGKGKGKFDYWAARVPVKRVIFELTGEVHEKVIRDAFRLAGHKLPGLYEFVKKGDPPIVGMTRLENGITLESLQKARREPAPSNTTEGPVVPPTTTADPPKTMAPPP